MGTSVIYSSQVLVELNVKVVQLVLVDVWEVHLVRLELLEQVVRQDSLSVLFKCIVCELSSTFWALIDLSLIELWRRRRCLLLIELWRR